MNRAITILLCCLLATTAGAQSFTIPSARSIDWTQVGIPGGIPNVTTVHANLTGTIDATGVTDVHAAVQSAMDGCPSNQVVILPAGTINVGATGLHLRNGVVLRGQGTGTLIIPAAGVTNIIWIDNSPIFVGYDATNLISGYTKGSTTLVVAGVPADLQVGEQIQIQQNNDPSLVNPVGIDGSAGDWCLGQWVTVIAIVGNTLTIDVPLYYTYSSTFNPRIRWNLAYQNPTQNNIQYAGLENVTVSNTDANCSANVEFNFAAFCWVKNITSMNGSISHVWTYNSFRCEVRDSIFTNIMAPITSSRGYGLQTGTPNSGFPCDKTTAMLIENDAWYNCRCSILLGYGASGCVIGYNYFPNTFSESPTILKQDVGYHSAHSYMNLVEGNIGTKINADNFHGSSSHNTIFRNYWRGQDAAQVSVSSLASVECDFNQWDYNIVGNVLGFPGVVSLMLTYSNPQGGTLYEALSPDATWSYGNWYKALMFGYDGEGGNDSGGRAGMDPVDLTGAGDPQAFNTALLEGNHDYVQNATTWTNGSGASSSPLTMPASLYLSSKPSFFGGAPFPLIGSDVSPMVNYTPLQGGVYSANTNGASSLLFLPAAHK